MQYIVAIKPSSPTFSFEHDCESNYLGLSQGKAKCSEITSSTLVGRICYGQASFSVQAQVKSQLHLKRNPNRYKNEYLMMHLCS